MKKRQHLRLILVVNLESYDAFKESVQISFKPVFPLSFPYFKEILHMVSDANQQRKVPPSCTSQSSTDYHSSSLDPIFKIFLMSDKFRDLYIVL
jgi:hypothetical protein